MSENRSTNKQGVIAAIDSATNQASYLQSTSQALDVFITGGSSSGTQYTTGASTPANPIGTIPVFDKSGTIQDVSLSNGLPVNIVAGSSSGTQYAELATTSPGTGTLSLGRYKLSAPTLTDGQLYGLQLDSSGNLKVTGSISVGGTTDEASFTAGTSTFNPTGGVFNDSATTLSSGQQGTQRFTTNRAGHVNLRTAAGVETGIAAAPLQVSLANTAANATAVKVDGSGVTQPVSLTSTTITGSVAVTQATASSLNATVVGTGTFAVQDTVLDAALIAQEATTSGVKGLTIFGAVTTAKPTYSTTKSDALSLDTSGLLRVSLADTPSNTNNFNVNLAASAATVTVSGTVTTTPPSNASTNIAQINGVTPLMGNGVTGTGSQRVTIASDNTAFSVNATLSAETTKVIGVTRTADGAGNLLTSNSTTPSAHFALDSNITSILGTAPTTVGKLDVKGADGDVFVRQTTAANLNTTTVQGTAAALTAGWPIVNGELADVTGTFTNATQTTSVTASSLDGYGNVLISINGTYGTATAVFEGSDDSGTTWYGISEADRTDSNTIESGYTSLTNTTRAWQISNPGWDSVRVRSTAVASGTVNVRISPSAAPTAAGASVSVGTALPAGTNVIGHVIADSGSTTAVTQATAASLNATIVGTGTLSVQNTAATPAGTNAIGTVGTTSAAINVGQQTVSTTAVQISASSTVPTNGIIVQALSTNAASIFVGGSGVTTTTGFELVAGQAMSFSCNLNTLYIRSAASTTDKICYNVL